MRSPLSPKGRNSPFVALRTIGEFRSLRQATNATRVGLRSLFRKITPLRFVTRTDVRVRDAKTFQPLSLSLTDKSKFESIFGTVCRRF